MRALPDKDTEPRGGSQNQKRIKQFGPVSGWRRTHICRLLSIGSPNLLEDLCCIVTSTANVLFC